MRKLGKSCTDKGCIKSKRRVTRCSERLRWINGEFGELSLVKEAESKIKETIIRAKLSQGGKETSRGSIKLPTQATRNCKDLEEE